MICIHWFVIALHQLTVVELRPTATDDADAEQQKKKELEKEKNFLLGTICHSLAIQSCSDIERSNAKRFQQLRTLEEELHSLADQLQSTLVSLQKDKEQVSPFSFRGS